MSGDLIPVLKVGENFSEQVEKADPDTLSLYRQVAPSVVRVETSTNSAGSGFAFGKEGQILTNFHVVVDAPEVFVRTQDGSRYRARVKKADDIKDLAVLEIEGNAPGFLKPLPANFDARLQASEKLASFGHPRAHEKTFISPGYFEDLTSNVKRLSSAAIANLNNEILASDADKAKFLENQLIAANIHIEKGNSGGPLVDRDGKVLGVNVYKSTSNDSRAYFVPGSDLRTFLDSKPKFNFEYEYQQSSELAQYLTEKPLLTSGLAAGAAYAGWRTLSAHSGLSRGLSSSIAGYGALGLINDIPELTRATNNRDLLKAGLHTFGDTALLAGGLSRAVFGSSTRPLVSGVGRAILQQGESKLATTIGGGLLGSAAQAGESYLTRAGKVGIALIAVGVAAKLASELIPDRLVNTQVSRLDGGKELPFYLGRERKP